MELTLLEAIKGLLEKKFSSLELTEECIKNIEKNRNLNAFITETFDLARERAKLSDKKIAEGKAGKMEGIPFGMKDIFCTKGIKTTGGSKIMENFVPPYESTVSQILSDEGYVMVGKTNMDEFAAAGTGKTSHFGATINSYKAENDNRDLIPGGSSSGSAVAVATGMCLASTGTDTGDSTRQPASLCNLVGIKPTYGRISRYGVFAYSSSLDHTGFFTKNVKDCAYLTPIVFGKDDKDSTTADKPVPDLLKNINPNIKGRKVGIVKQYEKYIENDILPDIRDNYYKSLEALKKGGAEIVEISLPTIEASSALYITISYTELGSNLSRYDGIKFGFRTQQKVANLDELYMKTRGEGFGENLKKRILLGSYMSSSENYEKYFLKSQKIRRMLFNEYLEAFKNVDVIFSPVTAGVAYPINPTDAEQKEIAKKGAIGNYFTIGLNMAGLPGISVPSGFSNNGLPIGMQFAGKHFDEQSILDFALFLEENK